jgi:hypothetical protein
MSVSCWSLAASWERLHAPPSASARALACRWQQIWPSLTFLQVGIFPSSYCGLNCVSDSIPGHGTVSSELQSTATRIHGYGTIGIVLAAPTLAGKCCGLHLLLLSYQSSACVVLSDFRFLLYQSHDIPGGRHPSLFAQVWPLGVCPTLLEAPSRTCARRPEQHRVIIYMLDVTAAVSYRVHCNWVDINCRARMSTRVSACHSLVACTCICCG